MDALPSSADNSSLLPVQNQSCDVGNRHPPWATVIPAYIYTVSALGIVLNLLVLLVFLLHKKPCTATEIYLSNMAAADLFLVFFLPFWGKYVSNGYSWTLPVCKTAMFLIALNYKCSAYFLVLVSIDRFLALVHPLSQRKLHRRKYAQISCMAVWLLGLLLNVPILVCRQVVAIEPLLDNKTVSKDTQYKCEWKCSERAYLVDEIIQTVVGLIPVLIIFFCSVKILQALKERPREDSTNNKGEHKVTVLVLAVLLAFLICWLPYRLQMIAELAVNFDHIEESRKLARVNAIYKYNFIHLVFLNSDINPILYVIIGKNFRERMWDVLFCRGF